MYRNEHVSIGFEGYRTSDFQADQAEIRNIDDHYV